MHSFNKTMTSATSSKLHHEHEKYILKMGYTNIYEKHLISIIILLTNETIHNISTGRSIVNT